MRLRKLHADIQRCGIQPDIMKEEFANWKDLPREKGCYSIWQGEICIYVGKAGGKEGFRGRFVHHDVKAFAKDKKGTTHTTGWVHYRTNMEDWNPPCWEIEYLAVNSEVHRTYLEGAMMLMFDPLCNYENFEDKDRFNSE